MAMKLAWFDTIATPKCLYLFFINLEESREIIEKKEKNKANFIDLKN